MGRIVEDCWKLVDMVLKSAGMHQYAARNEMANSLNISLEPGLREAADSVFQAIGLTTQDAVRMFLRQAVVKQRLPLNTEVSQEIPVTMKLSREATIAFRDILDKLVNVTPKLKKAMDDIASIPSYVRPLVE